MSLTGRHLAVAVDRCTPWVNYKKNYEGISGVAWDIFLTIAQQLNFTYTLSTSKDGFWGNDLGNGTVTGMVGMVYRKEVDLAIGPFVRTYSRSRVVDFSHPLYTDSYSILLPRPKIEKDLGNFLRPFRVEVWGGLVLSAFLATVLGYILEKSPWVKNLLQNTKMGHKKGVFFRPAWVLRVFTDEVVVTFPSIFSGKVFLITLMVSYLFLSSAYSAVLTALLAVPRVNIPVDSLEDLIEHGDIPWASERGSAQTQVFEDATFETNTLFTIVGQRMLIVDDCIDDQHRIVDEGIAFICNALQIKKMMDIEFSKKGTCSYYLAREPIITVATSIIFQKGSPLQFHFNRWIDSLHEAGLIEMSIRETTWNATTCLKKPGTETANNAVIFEMRDLGGIFLVMAAGAALGVIILLMERLVHFFN